VWWYDPGVAPWPADWKGDERSGWVQVGAMVFGLVMLGGYMMVR
jgi:hypothetical protein